MSRNKPYCTSWGDDIAVVHRAEDSPESRTKEALGVPGQYPFTRGVHSEMYRKRLWTMRQYAGFSDAAHSNARYRYLLEQGQTGLSIAFDLPTQLGLDSDHPLARGEVGKVGVAIDSLQDLEILLEGIPLDQVSISMTINSTALILLAMYIVVAKKQGVSREKLRGTTQNDILKEYIARGTYIFPPGPSLRLVVDLMQYCSAEVPLWNAISVSGYHIREAGSTPVHEVAFTLANAITYLECALRRNLLLDRIAPRISFFFNAHKNLFEEVAKFRAARRLWAGLMKDRFGAKSQKSWKLRFHTQTAGSTLTAQQPHNNLVRTTIEALAAVLGGTQSLHTNALDEALSLPTEQTALMALRTQQILAAESGVAHTVDPLGGSYYLESLTKRIELGSMKYLKQIEAMGGMLQAIERGFIQGEIQQAAYDSQKRLESGDEFVVGVNIFSSEKSRPIPRPRVDPHLERNQINQLRRLRSKRDARRHSESLERLGKSAESNDNLMPNIIECVESYATVGEISNRLRDIFGEHHEARSY